MEQGDCDLKFAYPNMVVNVTIHQLNELVRRDQCCDRTIERVNLDVISQVCWSDSFASVAWQRHINQTVLVLH